MQIAGFTDSSKRFVLDLKKADTYTYSERTAAFTVQKTLNSVRREIFGDQLSWRGNGYGIYNSETDSFDCELTERIKNCGVTGLRYPGGTQGDYFIWHETIGKNRIPQIDPFSKEYPVEAEISGKRIYPHFGWDEFIRFCSLTGLDAIVQLNAGNGTPKDAAELVRYCESKNLKVSSYCLGNEVNMKLKHVDGITVDKTPEEYVAFANEFFYELGDLRNRITLGVVALPSGHALHRHPRWDETVLKALGDKIDFVDCHYGYSTYFSRPENSENDVVSCFMASATYIKRLIEKTKKEIEVYAPKYADRIGIQITEYGPLAKFSNCMPGAVFLASLLQIMLAEPKITAGNHLPMLNHPNAPTLVGYDPRGGERHFWDNVCTYVFRWYSSQIGREALKTHICTPYIHSENRIGLIPPIYGADAADVAVYYGKEDKRGSLFVINRSPDKNMPFEITLPFSSVRITGISELYSDLNSSFNGKDSPNQITPAYHSKESDSFGGCLFVIAKPISIIKLDFEVLE